MAKIDFEAIARGLLADAERLVPQWLPDGKRSGAEYKPLNPKRGDGSPGSFSINLATGVWRDFAADVGGADLISLYAYVHDMSQGDAAKELSGALGITRDAPESSPKLPAKRGRKSWLPLLPVPSSAPLSDIPSEHYRLGKPSRCWRYEDGEGRLLFLVFRFDPPDGKKEFCPLTWASDGEGHTRWVWQAPPAPRPLYGLQQLAARPDAPVLICEGEKAADAGAELMPGFVAMASMGGAAAVGKNAWEVLAGRKVVIWRDADEPGQKYAEKLTDILLRVGEVQVSWVKLPEGVADGWDAADALADGWDAARIEGLLQAGEWLMPPALKIPKLPPEPPKQAKEPPFDTSAPPWPMVPNFFIDHSGVKDPQFQYICLRPVWVRGCTITAMGQFGIQIAFFDLDWKFRQQCIRASLICEHGGVLGRELQDLGLPVVPGKEKWLSRYLNQQLTQTELRIFAAERLGWHDSVEEMAFIMPNAVMGRTQQEVAFQPETYLAVVNNLVPSRCKLADWRREVADRARGNPFLMFSIMTALAGPLLKWARVENGGFHLWGQTSGGKTTALQVAASVWGAADDPQRGPQHTLISTWSNTGAALESTASAFNDVVLILDEIGKADPVLVSSSIYKLVGGVSKGRSSLAGSLRTQTTWRLLVLSSGEWSIKTVFANANQTMKGGQAVRFADIPVDSDTKERLIVTDHKGLGEKVYSDVLKLACARFYGVAGPAFVDHLIGEAGRLGLPHFIERVTGDLAAFERVLTHSVGPDGKAVPLDLPPELLRVITRFAAVAVAGSYAALAGIVNWDVTAEIVPAIRAVRDQWLKGQGEQRTEKERALARLASGIARHASRFVPIDAEPGPMLRDVLGYRAKAELVPYFVMGEDAIAELLGAGYDVRALLRELRDKKLLRFEEGRLTYTCPAIPSLGGARPKLYWISARIFGDLEIALPELRDLGPDFKGVQF